MTTALLDIITGISGDMTIAALIDAGASFDYLKSECTKLKLSGYELKISKLKRSQIEATKFDVVIHEKQDSHSFPCQLRSSNAHEENRSTAHLSDAC